MPEPRASRLADVIGRHQKDILEQWTRLQMDNPGHRRDLINDNDLAQQSSAFLAAFARAAASGLDIRARNWDPVRETLATVSSQRARQGFSPGETATFVFSLKQPIFDTLRQESGDAATMAADVWQATTVLDDLALYTIEVFQKGREEVIARQQEELLELSTPVVRLWEGVVALPLIGTLDSARTQVVMETLLQQIVQTGASTAIIDITGVPTVDTLVAQHLLKTVAAARLMGADCIISGIRPQIAQTIVHLGVDLGDVITKGSLADALALAMRRNGFVVTKSAAE